MNKQFFAWNLTINDTLTTSLTAQIITIALLVATICFLATLAYNYLKNGFEVFANSEKTSSFPDKMDIARTIVIFLMIVMYLPIAKTIVGTIETINSATASSSTLAKQTEKLLEAKATERTAMVNIDSLSNLRQEKDLTMYLKDENKQKQEDAGSYDKSMTKSLSDIATILNPSNLLSMGIHALTTMIVGIIRIIILGISVVIVKVLVILGPLALAFSILPVFKKQIEIWFSTLVTTGMVFTTINILDAIINTMWVALINPQAKMLSGDVTADMILALDLVIIILYTSSFWLTSKIVGKGDAGRIISKMVGTAAALTGLAISGGASAGASNVSNVAQAGKSIIEQSPDK